jgi:hypothetical protein
MNAIKQIVSQNDLKSVQDFNTFFNRNNMPLKAVDQEPFIVVEYTTKNDKEITGIARLFNFVFFDKEGNVVHYFEPHHYDCFENVSGQDLDFKVTNVVIYNEGSLVKVFYYQDKWYVGTSKKPESSGVFWNSEKSFKELFFEANQDYPVNTLDKECCYSFLLQHPEHFVTFQNLPMNVIMLNKINMSSGEVQRPVCEYYSSTLDIRQLQDTVNTRSVTENYIIYGQNADGYDLRIKMLSNAYKTRHSLIGNQQNVKTAYIKAFQEEKDQDFKQYLPEYNQMCNQIDTDIKELVKNVYTAYVLKYKAKQHFKMNEKYTGIIKKVHDMYLQKKNPIEIENVLDLVLKQAPNYIAYML